MQTTKITLLFLFAFISSTISAQPAVPQNLQGQRLDSSVEIKWNKIDNSSGDFLKYYIYMDTSPTAAVKVDSTETANLSDTTIVISGLTNNTAYYFRVAAVNSAYLVSDFSNEITLTPEDITAPPPPREITSLALDGEITITWPSPFELPLSGDYADFDDYTIYYGTAPDALSTSLAYNWTAPAGSPTFMPHESITISALTNNTKYYFAITCKDVLGNESQFSEIVTGTPIDTEVETNNDFGTANALDINIQAELTSADEDFFSFAATELIEYSVTTTIPSSKENTAIAGTKLFLYNSAFTLLASADVNGASDLAKLTYYCEASDTYYLKVTADNENQTGDYQISITTRSADIFEINNQITYATEMTSGASYESLSIFPYPDLDYYSIELADNESAKFVFQTDGFEGKMSVINNNSEVVKTVNNTGTNDTIVFNATYSGYYYVLYESANTATWPTGSYNLGVSVTPAASQSNKLVINEVQANAYSDNSTVQYIEITNTSTETVQLDKAVLNGDIEFEFPDYSFIVSNEYIVVASNADAFYSLYGFQPDYEWTDGSLNKTSVELKFSDASGQLIDYVSFSFPSQQNQNIENPSLEVINAQASNFEAANWQIAFLANGTPKKQNSSQSVYVADNFESNNAKTSAKRIFELEYALSFSAKPESNYADTVDWFYYLGEIGDTLSVNINVENTNALFSVYLLSEDEEVLYADDGVNANKSIEYMVDRTEKIYLKIVNTENESEYTLDVQINYPPKTIGWTENFNETPETNQPPYWLALDEDKNGTSWIPTEGSGISETTAMLSGGNVLGSNDWLITPMLAPADSTELLFYAKTADGTATFEIKYGFNNAKTAEEFIAINTLEFTNQEFEPFYIDLSVYAGDTIRLAIRNTTSSLYRQTVDDFSLQKTTEKGVLSGTVINSETSNPVENVRVTCGKQVVYTDVSGNYSFNKIETGTVEISFEKENFQTAKHTIVHVKTGSVQNLTLVPYVPEVLYVTNFEENQDAGYSDTNYASGWRRINEFSIDNKIITPTEGDSMLVFGGSTGYPISAYTLWINSSAFSIDLTRAIDANFMYKINYALDADKDKLYLIAKNANEGFGIIDLNKNGTADSDDYYSGLSDGWISDTLNLHDYIGFENGSQIQVGFLIYTDNSENPDFFGVAIDEIKLEATNKKVIAIPENLTATNYLTDKIELSWSAVENCTLYNVYRSDVFGQSQLLGSVPTTTFTDANITEAEKYYYTVSSVFPEGESQLTSPVYGISGTPQNTKIKFDQTTPLFFSEGFSGYIPNSMLSNWFVERSFNNKYNWVVGNKENAQNFTELTIPEHQEFYYLYHSEANFINSKQGDIKLITPWFDVSDVTTNVYVSFDSYSKTNENIVQKVLIRDFETKTWVVVDTIQPTDWSRIQLNLNNALALSTDTLIQIGFEMENKSNIRESYSHGWAIDSLLVQEIPNANIAGYVLSKANKPIFNAKIHIPSLNLNFYTDENGFFSANNLLLHNKEIKPEISADKYTDFVVETPITLSTFDTDTATYIINRNLPAPQNLQLYYTLDEKPQLVWEQPEKVGNIQNDTENFYTFYKLRNLQAIKYTTDHSVPVKITGISLCSAPGQTIELSTVKIVPADANGNPDMSTPYFEASNLVFNPLMPGSNSLLYPDQESFWYQATVNTIVDKEVFFVVFEDATQTIDFGVDNSSAVPLTLKYVDSQWKMDDYGVKMRAQFDEAVDFLYTYNVYRSANKTDYEQIATNLTAPVFLDNTANRSQTLTYAVKAQYNAGLSDFSNTKEYKITEKPWFELEPLLYPHQVEYTLDSLNNSLAVTNQGTDPLFYTAKYIRGFVPGFVDPVTQTDTVLQEYANWAAISVFDSPPQPGTKKTYSFYLKNFNNNPDADWVQKVVMHFPLGISVENSSDFVQSGSDLFLYSNQSNGNGATVEWNDPNLNEWGEIQSLQIAVSEIELSCNTELQNDFYIYYEIYGHQGGLVVDSLQFSELPFDVVLSEEPQMVAASGTAPFEYQININRHTPGIYPGYFMFYSNAINYPAYFMPVYVFMERQKGTISGRITNKEYPDIILANQPVVLSDTINRAFQIKTVSDSDGKFSFENVPASSYFIQIYNKDYEPYTAEIKLSENNQEIIHNISATPKIAPVVAFKATDNKTSLTLSWDGKNHKEQFYGYVRTAISAPWTVVDADQNGKSFEYTYHPKTGNMIAAVRRNTDKNADWLISPTLELTDKSNLKFMAGNTSNIQKYAEQFNVKISTTDKNTESFTTTLLTHTFTQPDTWQEFSVDLSAYAANDSVWIAFEYVSANMEYLYIDDVEFSNLKELPKGVTNESFLNYHIYKSSDNQLFTKIASVTRMEYTDTEAIPGIENWYKVKTEFSHGISPASETLNAKIANIAPTLGAIANTETDEDNAVTIPLVYADENQTVLSVAVSSDNENVLVAVADSKVTLTPKPNWFGETQINVNVTDNIDTINQDFIFTVNSVNDLPQFASTPNDTAWVNQLYEYFIDVQDTDNELVSIDFENLPTWLTFNALSKTISGTPVMDDQNQYTFKIIASDGIGDAVEQNVTLDVIYVNLPPVIASIPQLSVLENQEYTYKLEVSDPDNDLITVRVTSLPQWLEFSSESLQIQGTPKNEDVGMHLVTIQVFDRRNPAVEQTFMIEVKDVNQQPVFISEPTTQAYEKSEYSYLISVLDSDNDQILIELINSPSWLNYSTQTNTISGVPPVGSIGNYDIQIKATDRIAAPIYQNFTLTVLAENLPPQVISNPVTTAQQSNPYYYIIVADDEFPDQITFTPKILPHWLSLNHQIGDNFAILQGVPPTSAQDTIVSILITDNLNNQVNHLFPILFSVTSANDKTLESKIMIYPNPVESRMFIELKDEALIESELVITNMQGKIIYTKTLLKSVNDIDVKSWSNGYYIVTIFINDKKYTKRIIVE